MEIDYAMFWNFQSYISLESTVITDIKRIDNTFPQILVLEGASSSNVTNTTFNSINFGVFRVFYSWIDIQDSVISEVVGPNYIFQGFRSTSTVMNNLTIYNSGSTNEKSMLSFWDCSSDTINNSNFTENQPVTARFINSHLLSFDNNILNGMNRGLLFTSGSTGKISNSTITNMVQNIKDGDIYAQELEYNGGAIEVENSHIEVTNCIFSHNKAISGGAIYVGCDVDEECTNIIKDNTFINNTATGDGGAVAYSSYSPQFENDLFINNSAYFGNDISSYAARVMQIKGEELVEITSLENIPSGVVIDEPIELVIVNVEGEIVTRDNTSVIKFYPVQTGSQVQGQSTTVVTKGRANFTTTIFQSSPGATDIEYLVSSSAINYARLKVLDPIKYADQIVKVNFRWCKPGEIQIDDTCYE